MTYSENIALLETIAEYQELAEKALLVQHSVRNALHYLTEARKLTARLLSSPPLTTLTPAEAISLQRQTIGETFNAPLLERVREVQRLTQ